MRKFFISMIAFGIMIVNPFMLQARDRDGGERHGDDYDRHSERIREHRSHEGFRHEGCHRGWFPQYKPCYEEQIWIPGRTIRIWVGPEERWEWRLGRQIRVYYAGHYEETFIPGHYETVVR